MTSMLMLVGRILIVEKMKLTSRRPAQRCSYAAQVDNDGLDAISLALNLGQKTFHFVAVKGIRDILVAIRGQTWSLYS